MIQAINPIKNINHNYCNSGKSLYGKNLTYSNDSVTFKGNIQANKLHPIFFLIDNVLLRSVKVSQKSFLYQIPELQGKIKDVTIRTIDNKTLNCWDINPNQSQKYILFLHGLSQNITHNQKLYAALNKNNYGVLALEYRGFGKNKKTKINEKLIGLDVDAALKYLRKKTSMQNISIIGHSAGAFMAVDIAQKKPDLGMIILVAPINGIGSAYSNILAKTKNTYTAKFIQTLTKKYPAFIKTFDSIFKADTKLANVESPTYIIHSLYDKVVNFNAAKELSAKAKNLTGFIELSQGGHRLDENKIETVINVLNSHTVF